MQGWDPIVIKEIFDSALKKLFQSNQVPNPTATGPVPSLMPQQHFEVATKPECLETADKLDYVQTSVFLYKGQPFFLCPRGFVLHISPESPFVGVSDIGQLSTVQ